MAKFWQVAKTFVVPAVGAAASLAAQGTFGPKAAAAAAALTTLWSLFVKRPQDQH